MTTSRRGNHQAFHQDFHQNSTVVRDHRWEPSYRMGPSDRDLDDNRRVELAATLELLRRRVCHDGPFHPKRGAAASDFRIADLSTCDCKYGLSLKFLDFSASTVNPMNEMTGCPELRELIYRLLHGDIATDAHRIEDLTNEVKTARDSEDDWAARDQRSRDGLGIWAQPGWATDRCVTTLVKHLGDTQTEYQLYRRQADDEIRRVREENQRLTEEVTELQAEVRAMDEVTLPEPVYRAQEGADVAERTRAARTRAMGALLRLEPVEDAQGATQPQDGNVSEVRNTLASLITELEAPVGTHSWPRSGSEIAASLRRCDAALGEVQP